MEFDVRNQGIIPLIQHPDFSALGYEVIRELGHNQQGGRITYLARVRNSQQMVVIKAFYLAHRDADWLGITAYEREVQILQKLNHPRIPRYIDSFTTFSGFYIVQEYKNAPSLASLENLNIEAIQQIALSVLEILVYLQQRVDVIIHRDIKPENILVDEQLNAYLIDFDLAHIQGERLALSSLASGTPCFMPPEEHLGQAFTPASDLYSVGATVIYLLAKTHALNFSQLIDDHYRFDLQQLRAVNPPFLCWLKRMVEPKWQYRYPNAASALALLETVRVTGRANFMESLMTFFRLTRHSTVIVLAIIGVLATVGMILMTSQQVSITEQSRKMSQ